MSVLYNLKPPWWSINIQVWVTTASETQHALELFNQNVRVATDQGQESISQSLTCVKDNGELFSLTLILIVSLEIKNYRFCLNCVISCFFASLSRHSKPAGSPFFAKTWQLWSSFYWSCGKLQCAQSDLTSQLLKMATFFFLQSIYFHFTGNVYYV